MGWRLACSATAILLGVAAAGAHGFGQRYDLPLPLSHYLFGTAAAVVLSFVVVALLLRHAPQGRRYPRVDLLAYPFGRLLAHRGAVLALKVASVALFVVAVTAGFAGDQNPYRNIAPTLVWIVWWVGFAYVSAFVGNLWELINPWRAIFDGAESLSGRRLSLGLRYPQTFGVWPACLLLLAFSWTELVYPAPAVPVHIAWLAVGYSVLTWTGMILFGAEAWTRHGEVFSVVFGTFARFAPTEVRVRDAALCARCEMPCRSAHGECIDCYDCFRRADLPQRELALRPYGAGLLDDRPVSMSTMAFVLLLLSSVLYDGLLATPEWSALENSLGVVVAAFGQYGAIVVRTAGLIGFWLLFLSAYLAVAAMMSTMAADGRAPGEIARSFAFTLVPIAIGYHLAHYLVFLLVQGQYIVPLISDPFGFGWNLFGTAGYRVDIGLVGARFAWYAALAAILGGHIAAVCLAHLKATQVFALPRAAFRSQVPLTALMVIYTVISLSILAEPIVERRAPAQPSVSAAAASIAVPDDAVLPQPGTGRLQPVGPGTSARQKLTYRVLGSAFHDGTRTTAADLLYAYMFAWRWGASHGTGETSDDPAVAAATAPMRRHLAGVRVIGADTASKTFRVGDVSFVRELFEIEVYASVATEDPERDAAVAAPWSTLPWHVVVLMEEAVTRGWAAFSQSEAVRRGVPWLDLVRSDDINRRLASLIETFAREGYRPAALQALASAEEARQRWAALAAFHRAHHHFLVTNGPYRLKSWTPDGATLEAFRDLTYPLGVGSYDAYAIPRRGFITKVAWDGGRVTLSAEVEIVEKFQRSYRLARTPLESLAAERRRRAAPECRYTVVDGHHRVVLAGSAGLTEDSTFRIDFAGRLPPGPYTLLAFVAVNGNAMNPEIRRVPLDVPADP